MCTLVWIFNVLFLGVLFISLVVSLLTLPLSSLYNGYIALLQNRHANYLLEVLCTLGKMGDQIKVSAVYNPWNPCWKNKTDAQMLSDLCAHVRICVYICIHTHTHTHMHIDIHTNSTNNNTMFKFYIMKILLHSYLLHPEY